MLDGRLISGQKKGHLISGQKKGHRTLINQGSIKSITSSDQGNVQQMPVNDRNLQLRRKAVYDALHCRCFHLVPCMSAIQTRYACFFVVLAPSARFIPFLNL